MTNWSTDETRLYLLSLSFDTDHEPEATLCWMQCLFLFFLGGGVGVGMENENTVQVKPGNNSESGSPNVALSHPWTEKPEIHVWHGCPTATTEPGCSLMPFPALWAMPFVAGLPLLLPCACPQAPACADAVLCHFQSGMEAGLAQGVCSVPVRGSGCSSCAAGQHPRHTPCLRAALAGRLSAAYWVSSRSRDSACRGSV